MLDWNLYYTKQQNNHRMSIRNEIGVPVNYNYFGIPTLDRPYLVTFFIVCYLIPPQIRLQTVCKEANINPISFWS